MHIIARPAITAAKERHKNAADWLDCWWQKADDSAWTSLADVREDYPATDQVGQCLIFDVGGNNYRLICRVTYANEWTRGTLLVKHFLTHAEYDKNKWCGDCVPPTKPAKRTRRAKKAAGQVRRVKNRKPGRLQ